MLLQYTGEISICGAIEWLCRPDAIWDQGEAR